MKKSTNFVTSDLLRLILKRKIMHTKLQDCRGILPAVVLDIK